MNFLEKDLEQIIWESENFKLQQRGLDIYGKKYRQLKIGNYGISDLITVYKDYYYCNLKDKKIPFLEINVFELKREKVGISALLQAIKYCKGIKTYLEHNKPNLLFTLNIILAAKEVDKSGEFIYITDLLGVQNYNFRFINEIKYYRFDYSIDGIKFTQEVSYDLINKGF